MTSTDATPPLGLIDADSYVRANDAHIDRHVGEAEWLKAYFGKTVRALIDMSNRDAAERNAAVRDMDSARRAADDWRDYASNCKANELNAEARAAAAEAQVAVLREAYEDVSKPASALASLAFEHYRDLASVIMRAINKHDEGIMTATPADSPTTEITPEMIEAGSDVLMYWNERFEPWGVCVEKIYLAMCRAKEARGGVSGPRPPRNEIDRKGN